MSMPSASLMVGLFDQCVCIKISGRATFTSSVDLKKVVEQLTLKGFDHFVLDLRECLTMDSTFLGVLSGVGLRFAQPECHRVSLVSPQPRVRDLIESLGVSELFKFFDHAPAAPGKFEALQNTDTSRSEITRTCLEAHKLLMTINPENVVRFKDVTRFLAEDLKRQEEEEKCLNQGRNGELGECVSHP